MAKFAPVGHSESRWRRRLRRLEESQFQTLRHFAFLCAVLLIASQRPCEFVSYDVVYQDPEGVFEIRQYSPYSVVQAEMESGNNSFFSLAGYIFGRTNAAEEKMKMTTPVQIDKANSTMSFILPSRYWGDGLQSAPNPKAGAGVWLEAREKEVTAVSIFGGYARAGEVSKRKEALLSQLRNTPGIDILDPDAVKLFQYNDPFTVPWKRRNELSVAVRLSQPASDQ
eukprot:TRINITY_DN25116_c2_g1_i3.p1 TRINITY_DN25116_c2_g1~~TRINITY_DN25116_c2_g1_i3.p1  ORF type:complete len:245 (+),score=22.92 TRINITY_DN25116_c2_g1_i3:63-737(+)